MVTNYPQQLAATVESTHDRSTGVVSRAMGRLGQMLCGVRGHDSVLHFEDQPRHDAVHLVRPRHAWLGDQRPRPAPPLRGGRAASPDHVPAARSAQDRVTAAHGGLPRPALRLPERWPLFVRPASAITLRRGPPSRLRFGAASKRGQGVAAREHVVNQHVLLQCCAGLPRRGQTARTECRRCPAPPRRSRSSSPGPGAEAGRRDRSRQRVRQRMVRRQIS